MPKALTATRRPVMAAFSCLPTAIARSIIDARAPAAGMKRMRRWAIVALTFPIRSPPSSDGAQTYDEHSCPDGWEAIIGYLLGPANLVRRTSRAFELDIADDWIVISAILSDQQSGFTEVIARPGRSKAGPNNVVSLSPRMSIVSAASGSSSIRSDTPSMAGRRALSAGKGDQREGRVIAGRGSSAWRKLAGKSSASWT